MAPRPLLAGCWALCLAGRWLGACGETLRGAGPPLTVGAGADALMMVLTYTGSERLRMALRTWMPACAALGFDVGAMVYEPDAGKVSQLSELVPEGLRSHIRVYNTFSALGNSHGLGESRELERWKTKAYVSQVAQEEFSSGTPGRYRWFVQMDDDALPDCKRTCEYIKTAGKGGGARYLGVDGTVTPTFVSGAFVLMNRQAFQKLSEKLAEQPLRSIADASHCDPPYQDGVHSTDCCAMAPMVYADVMIASCLGKAGVKPQSLGSAPLFRHPLKDPKALLDAWLEDHPDA